MPATCPSPRRKAGAAFRPKASPRVCGRSRGVFRNPDSVNSFGFIFLPFTIQHPASAGLLADEPTVNLDSKNSQEIVELLKMSNKKYGQTLVIITHDENIALQAHRVIAIEDGRITRDERIREVLE